MKNLSVFILLTALLSCSAKMEQEANFLECLEDSSNYKLYKGEEIACKFFFRLAEFNDAQYIELGSHFADLTRSVVINEDCFDICESDPYDPNSPCGKYLAGREIIEVIFIEK